MKLRPPKHPKTKQILVGGYNPVAFVRSVIGMRPKAAT